MLSEWLGGSKTRPKDSTLTRNTLCRDDRPLAQPCVQTQLFHDLPRARPHADACTDFFELRCCLVHVDGEHMWGLGEHVREDEPADACAAELTSLFVSLRRARGEIVSVPDRDAYFRRVGAHGGWEEGGG